MFKLFLATVAASATLAATILPIRSTGAASKSSSAQSSIAHDALELRSPSR